MDVVQHQILSLDFWQDTVSYEGKNFPSGTIGCDALNIPALKRKNITRKEKEIATAIYLYQVDFDGEWGEIYFDFVNRVAEIQQLAEWDRMISKIFAKKAICYMQNNSMLINLKELVIPFFL